LAARIPDGGAALAKTSGEITVNGKPRNETTFRNLSAYVLQDDNLFAHLTVQETLMLAAHFFLPTETPLDEKLNLVSTLLADLGLSKTVNTIIGSEKVRGVSGGERKRASIAVQLISDPAVLFLDEPTSGLDAFQAQSVMDSMKNLAVMGRVVISVIHQPRSSIFSMFDKLVLLSEGRTMYFGDADKAVEYFASNGHVCPDSFNPSDYYLDILSPDNRNPESEQDSKNRIKHLGDRWLLVEVDKLAIDSSVVISNTYSDDIKAIGSDMSMTKTIRNFQLLCWRSFAEQSRDKTTIFVKIFISSLFAFLLGGIYSNVGYSQRSVFNRIGLLFFVCINTAFNSIQAVLNSFPREKLIVNRERSGRAYNTLSYFVAKFGVEIPLTIFPSVIFACILFWLVGLNKTTFGYFILILNLLTLTTVALGMMASAIAPNVEAASAIGTPLIIIAILFGGFYITIDSLPIVANWIPYMSFLRWGFQALCINEFSGLRFQCSGYASGCFSTGEQVLQYLGFDGHTTNYPVFGLGMLLIAFLIITYILVDRGQMSYLSLGHTGAKYASFKKNSPKKVASTSLELSQKDTADVLP